MSLMDWFINEQIEEEYAVLKIFKKFELLKDSPAGFMIIDSSLGER